MDKEILNALEEFKAAHTEHVDKVTERYDQLSGDILARLETVEMAVPRPGIASDPKAKAFTAYLRHGFDAIGDDHRSNLTVSSDTSAGYLAPDTFEAMIVKDIVQHSPVRQYATVTTISTGGVTMPRLDGRPTAHWVEETEDRTETDLFYGQISIPAHEAACYVDISVKLIEDAAVNIEAEIAAEFGVEFGRLENEAYLLGDGFKKPKGLLTEDLTKVKSGAAATLTADGLIDLNTALPSPYARNAIWAMNRNTMGKVRKLKSGDGQYLWQEGLSAGNPPTILGRPVVEFPDLPDVGAGTLPIIFGDFTGYRIVDRVGLSLLRDPFTRASKGQVRIHARRRTGGGMLIKNKFVAQEVGTA